MHLKLKCFCQVSVIRLCITVFLFLTDSQHEIGGNDAGKNDISLWQVQSVYESVFYCGLHVTNLSLPINDMV